MQKNKLCHHEFLILFFEDMLFFICAQKLDAAIMRDVVWECKEGDS